MEDIMRKRIAEAAASYEACWDNGRGSHHPDYSPDSEHERENEKKRGISSSSSLWKRADRATEELYAAIVADDVPQIYKKLEEGADPNHEFGLSYKSREGYTLLMVAAHRGRLEAAKALLRAGADPNHVTRGGKDSAFFWAIDGGVEMISLFIDYGADVDAVSPKGWTPLSYAKAKGKYGAPEEKGIYPEDVLKYYGAKRYGTGPVALGSRSPRESFDPSSSKFLRERGTYSQPQPHP